MNGRTSKFLRREAKRLATTAPGLVSDGRTARCMLTHQLYRTRTTINNPDSFRSVLSQLKKYVSDTKHGYTNPAAELTII